MSHRGSARGRPGGPAVPRPRQDQPPQHGATHRTRAAPTLDRADPGGGVAADWVMGGADAVWDADAGPGHRDNGTRMPPGVDQRRSECHERRSEAGAGHRGVGWYRPGLCRYAARGRLGGHRGQPAGHELRRVGRPGDGRRRRRFGAHRRGGPAGRQRPDRRAGRVRRMGPGRRRRTVHDRGGQGPAGDQLLGLRAGGAAGAAGDAGAGQRAHRADEFHRRRHRYPVPGFLQREQVRPGGPGGSPRVRGGAPGRAGDAGPAGQYQDGLHG